MGQSQCKEQASAEQEVIKLPVQCVGDPMPLNAVVDYGGEAIPIDNHHPCPGQCFDDPTGSNAIEDLTFSMPNQTLFQAVIQREADGES